MIPTCLRNIQRNVFLSLGPQCFGPHCACAQSCDELADGDPAQCTSDKCPGCLVCPFGHVVNNGSCVLPTDPLLGCKCFLNGTLYKVSGTPP